MDYQEALDKVYEMIKQETITGKVADYIPELAKVNPDLFAIHLLTVDGDNYSLGNNEINFSAQSIVKVLTLTLALEFEKDKLWERVNMEPSGNPFNSVVQLEYENGIPRNPFINAGAIVVCDILLDHLKDPAENFLGFVKRLTCNADIKYNTKIADSEKATGFRNYALANFMKAHNNINNNIEDVMNFYFTICSLELSCRDLCNAFILFANRGKLLSGERVITVSQSKRINAIMQTCGFYDQAGLFSYKIGLPGKSGVGGGIIAIHPGNYAIAVYSPRLNEKGNSALGMKFLEEFTTVTEVSIF
jgi:glutaminase